MTRPSLRWRLALLSSALAGGVLVGFALLSGWLTYQAKLDRLDAQLRSSLQPLGRPHNGDPLANPEIALAQGMGLTAPEAVALVLVDRNNALRYQSPWWPEDLTLPRSVPAVPSPNPPGAETNPSRLLRPSLPNTPSPQQRRGMRIP